MDPKRQRQNIAQMSKCRGFKYRSQSGLFYLVGLSATAKCGPATYEQAKAFLAEYPTSKQIAAEARANAAREARAGKLVAVNPVSDYAKRRRGFGALYEPDYEEEPPGLIGLRTITILLPPGADSDDCLRGLWVAENRVLRRGAPAVKEKLEEAWAMLKRGGLVSRTVTLSDHDLASCEAYEAEPGVVMLAAYLARVPFIPGAGRSVRKEPRPTGLLG